MITWWFVMLAVGVNFSLWGTIGALRLLDESAFVPVRDAARGVLRRRTRDGRSALKRPVDIAHLAVLMAAHNEELVISASLDRLAELVPKRNIHVVSDGSSDATVELAREAGVNIIETPRNVGKAGALCYAIEQFSLLKKFRAVMVLDADTQLDRRYFHYALPLFDDPYVVAVAGCAQTRWQRRLKLVGNLVVAHRQRVYVLTQLLMKYGQTWRGISATHIVPGFASIYRTSALKHITINRPGLVIEDFNMTFDLQAKRLGRIAFHPLARAYTQDPAAYGEYVRQVRRWSLGLWQTVRRSRPRRAVFAGSLALTLLELITSSVMYLLLPFLVLLLAVVHLMPGAQSLPVLSGITGHVGLADVGLGIALPDYVLTCAVCLLERRPRYLLLGLFFLPMKITDAAIALYTLPRAWLDRSTGQWVSPTRRAEQVADGSEVA